MVVGIEKKKAIGIVVGSKKIYQEARDVYGRGGASLLSLHMSLA